MFLLGKYLKSFLKETDVREKINFDFQVEE